MCGDGHSGTVDGQVAVRADAFAAVVRGGQGDGEVAARNINIGVALDGRAIGGNVLVINRFQDRASRRGYVDDSSRNVDVVVCLDAFRHIARVSDADGASVDENVAVGLDAFTVGACGGHVKRSVIHGEIARHLDTSLTFRCCMDGQVAVLDGDIA